MASVTLVLVDMASGAAIGDFSLRHSRIHFHLDVGFIVQRMGWTAFGPLIFGPCNRIALGLSFGEFLQVAGAARIGSCHSEVLLMVGLLCCIDVIMTVDTADFFQLLFCPQLAD